MPTDDPEDRKRFDAEVEAIAVKVAWAFEEAAGAVVKDVSKPHLARAAGLEDNPGFDLLSRHPGGGRAGHRGQGPGGRRRRGADGERVGRRRATSGTGTGSTSSSTVPRPIPGCSECATHSAG